VYHSTLGSFACAVTREDSGGDPGGEHATPGDAEKGGGGEEGEEGEGGVGSAVGPYTLNPNPQTPKP